MKTKMIFCVLFICGLISCADTKIDSINGKVVSSNIIGNSNYDGKIYKIIELKIEKENTFYKNKQEFLNINIMIPLNDRNIESLPLEDNELINEFPINALIKTKLEYANGKNSVIINSVQDNIVEYYP